MPGSRRPAVLASAPLLVAIAAACASAPTTAPPGRQPVTPDAVAIVEQGPQATVGIIAAEPAAVLRAATAAYEQLGIPLGSVDADTGVAASGELNLRRRLGGVRLSTYLECGGAPTGPPAADRQNVRAGITTTVTRVRAGSRVETRIRATARTDRGSETPCASRGTLEERILQLIAERVLPGDAGHPRR